MPGAPRLPGWWVCLLGCALATASDSVQLPPSALPYSPSVYRVSESAPSDAIAWPHQTAVPPKSSACASPSGKLASAHRLSLCLVALARKTETDAGRSGSQYTLPSLGTGCRCQRNGWTDQTRIGWYSVHDMGHHYTRQGSVDERTMTIGRWEGDLKRESHSLQGILHSSRKLYN